MKKKLVTIILAGALTVSSAFTALAGWEQVGTQWKYSDNGAYLTGWKWLDGNGDSIAECYYLNNDGIMLSNTITPDNFTVNENGAWTVNGIVQTKVVGEDTSTSHDNKTSTPTPQTQPTNSNPQVETPTTGGGQSMADVFPGWEGGEPSYDDIIEGGGGAAGSWH